MKPLDYFLKIDSLSPKPLHDGLLVPVSKTIIREVHRDTVSYGFMYLDTRTNTVYSERLDLCLDVPVMQEFSVRLHLIRHGYKVFTLSV